MTKLQRPLSYNIFLARSLIEKTESGIPDDFR